MDFRFRARRLRRIALCLGAVCGIAMSGCATQKNMNGYSQKITYAANRDLPFPDFTLRFLGQRKVIPAHYPHGFIAYDFRVTDSAGQTQKIIWSSGTGLIDWTDFAVGEKKFGLELQHSLSAGNLAPDELSVSPLETLTAINQSKAIR